MAFDAKEEKIATLLSQCLLEIPRNQRHYVWDKTNWEDMLSDIKFIVERNSENEHFLGSIVLRSEEPISGIEKYSIIDGQQRTITIILFLLALIRIFVENEHKDYVKGTIQYLYVKDRKNVEHLILNSENHISLRDLANNIRKSKKDTPTHQILASLTISKSDKIYLNAFNYFYNELNKILSEKGFDYILKIKDSLLDSKYIRIKADTEEDAYTVFEILNARGSTLEDYELLKNYIMRYILPKEKVDEVKIKWAEIERILGTQIKSFFRHYVTHKIGSSSSDVYRSIQNRYPKENVGDLLDDIYKKSSLYGFIISPDPSRSNVEFEILSFLKSHKSQQLRPLILSLISGYESGMIPEKTYLSTLDFLKNFFVCFTLISSEKSNRLSDVIDKYAPELEKFPNKETIMRLLESMKKKLPDFNSFKRIFMELGYSNHYEFFREQSKKKLVLVALKLIESHLSPGFTSTDCTIEHILPDAESKDNAKIGNLTLLEHSLNERCKTKSFYEKLNIYEESNYKMTRKLSSLYKTNSLTFNIDTRAEKLANAIYYNILNFSGE